MNNNIPAFPLTIDSNGHYHTQEGMTLRDYFAAKAMQSIVESENYIIPLTDDDMIEDEKGRYIKSTGEEVRYFIPNYSSMANYSNEKHYSIKASVTWYYRIAREAYKYADAMLEVREDKHECI